MNDMKLQAWTSFVDVVKKFFGNHRVENYKTVINLLKSLLDIVTNMSIKVHFLHSPLYKFLDNCSDVSDEQEERFPQDIKTMKERYQRRCE